jgi:hypothetical protein
MREGRGPVTIMVGTRRIVTDEADQEWRLRMEAETTRQ